MISSNILMNILIDASLWRLQIIQLQNTSEYLYTYSLSGQPSSGLKNNLVIFLLPEKWSKRQAFDSEGSNHFVFAENVSKRNLSTTVKAYANSQHLQANMWAHAPGHTVRNNQLAASHCFGFSSRSSTEWNTSRPFQESRNSKAWSSFDWQLLINIYTSYIYNNNNRY